MIASFNRLRRAAAAGLVLLLAAAPAAAQSRAETEAAFRAWLAGDLRPEAARQGIGAEAFAAATAGLSLDWSLPDLHPPGRTPAPPGGSQAEFGSPGRYFDPSGVDTLVRLGRERLRQWSGALDAIERRFGVPREIVVAIWGRESSFGRAALPHDAVRTLATRAFMGRRKDYFRAELIAALAIVARGEAAPGALRSSWAGALGQPQFMPSMFLRYAVDGDGDGRRDIWNSVPDTLASIASHLAAHGWQRGAAWGFEAAVPETVPCTLEGPHQGRPLSAWTGAGVAPVGRPAGIDPRRNHFLLMPAGRRGPSFMVTENFYVLKSYNESDLYALYIGHLADRMRGGAPFAGRWQAVGGFTGADVRQMQLRLEAAGHDVGGADGLVGFRTRIAVGAWQAASGRAPTCFPDRAAVRDAGGT